MLKQKSHLLSYLAHHIQSQAGDVLSMNAHRTGVGFFQADNQPQQHAFSCAAAPQHRQRLPAAHAQIDPVQNPLPCEGLPQVLNGNNRHTAFFLRFPLFRRIVVSCGHFYFKCASRSAYGKKTRMNFTSTTSARIRNSEPSTTEFVAARPTPEAPPRARIP